MNVNKSQELQKTRPIITVKQARRFLGEDFKDMSDTEIEAVLAHELGHFKRRHITKRIVLMFAVSAEFCSVGSL